MMMIYKGVSIAKIRDNDFTKGDVGYVEDIDLPELIQKIRFLLTEVVGWEEYKETEPFFKDRRRKLRIMFETMSNIIIVEDLDRFDAIMDELYQPDDSKPFKFERN